jgi:hypothetical protein
MAALQGMGQNGGWPMSMFLTPDLKPFYGGTYFPPESKYGRIGFPDLLKRIHGLWQNDREKIIQSSEALVKFLHEMPASMSAVGGLNPGCLDTCFHQFSQTYDPQFAGFGGGPKFPRPAVFNFLLRYYDRTGNKAALEMSANTLRKMSMGGMYDHIGGGFHRYSVDAEWRVPHFEKMLYDQAQLVNSYIDLYLITKDLFYATVIRDVLEYVGRDMTPARHRESHEAGGHLDGGFYSAEDADSPNPESPEEKGEGAFYIWSKKEIVDAFGSDSGEMFCFYYGVEDSGNAPFDPQHEFTGKNILYVAHTAAQTAKKFGKEEKEVTETLARSRASLFALRAKRIRPGLDDKILTSWNGLMISAFARAYQVLDDPAYLQRAEHAAQFILSHLYDPQSKTLRRRFRDGEAKYDAHLDDYAFFVQGLLDLYESSLSFRWLKSAIELTQTQIDLFWDRERGGFFDTSGKDSSILVRMKEQYDGAEPTGNSIAVMNLLRLSQMTDNDDWRAKAEQTLALFGEVLQKQPVVMPQMAATYDFSISKTKQIIVAGKRDEPETRKLFKEIYSRYIPNRIILFADGGVEQKQLALYLSFVSTMSMANGKPTAYICEDYVCQLPASDLDTVSKLLAKKE